MEKKKIIAVTGARSEYDLLYSVYKRLNESDHFDFGIVVTGPHLSDSFGSTVQNVEKDGFKIVSKIFNLLDSNQKIGRIISLGLQIPSLANVLYQEQPDIVLVAGDREEAISVTLTCAYMDIPVAHFFGGDIAKDGNIDNSVRYAASKLAHLHFVTLPEHRNTLLKLGEEDERIFVVGNPALDRIVETDILDRKATLANITDKAVVGSYCVLIQHPIITQVELQAQHIRITLDAILSKNIHCFINYPNSDAGFSEIVKAYDEYSSKYPANFTLFKNLDRLTYINLLRNAAFLIGNSSSGIVEVASLGLPAINVGERQRGRLHGNNVIFVDNDHDQISRAIDKSLSDENFKAQVKATENRYGAGDSSEKIINILQTLKISDALVHKNITYL